MSLHRKMLHYGAVASIALIVSWFLSGCDSVEARGKKRADRLASHSIQVNGEERTYVLYVPPSYKGRKPVPLVLHFHGGGGNGENEAKSKGWPEVADRHGFIVAFPNGTKRWGNEGGGWNITGGELAGYAERKDIDDVAFVKELIGLLQRTYAIDQDRIYATGMSMGGAFAYHIACAMPGVFAAVAPVSATLVDSRCQAARSVALLHIHGTDDQNVPLQGGKGRFTAARNEWPPVMQGIEFWRSANNCNARAEQVSKGKETTCWRYPGCGRGTTVGYCFVEGGGHAWPGTEQKAWQRLAGAHVSQSFNATAEIWNFFSQHAR